jgi:hypothetical protein
MNITTGPMRAPRPGQGASRQAPAPCNATQTLVS